ncbi:hypothetical protein JTE90_019850 [Oedothorax gibbosus]|uniref:T-box domain-containing protein n=1 Tax=Oedothorax gibbosus TaxID=931172 RepID=A0AAV6VZZ3_9ARAC|nr:hypothetical protein JTE90_019850 [Oedothorax gibbosus]
MHLHEYVSCGKREYPAELRMGPRHDKLVDQRTTTPQSPLSSSSLLSPAGQTDTPSDTDTDVLEKTSGPADTFDLSSKDSLDSQEASVKPSASSKKKGKDSSKDKAPPIVGKCNCEELKTVEAHLETKDLWEKFHSLGTEMIITKTGRTNNFRPQRIPNTDIPITKINRKRQSTQEPYTLNDQSIVFLLSPRSSDRDSMNTYHIYWRDPP